MISGIFLYIILFSSNRYGSSYMTFQSTSYPRTPPKKFFPIARGHNELSSARVNKMKLSMANVEDLAMSSKIARLNSMAQQLRAEAAALEVAFFRYINCCGLKSKQNYQLG
jgi:hypothetical protein